MSRPIRVVICDDVASLRFVLTVVCTLDEDVEVVGEAADGHEALAVAESLRPDVLLLDLSMPQLDGFEVLERLPAVAPDTRVVVLSGLSRDVAEARALELGAAGYVEKGAPPEQILAAVRDAAGVYDGAP